MSEVRVPTTGAELPAYLAIPGGEAPWPGVVVLHDLFGMTDDLRRQADGLAAAGFLTVAPDLFHRSNKAVCIRTVIRDQRAGRGRTFDDVDAVRRWLVADPRCTGRVGVVGFCLTGGFALLLARGHGFVVSGDNYGTLPAHLDEVVTGACPVVASYGARDKTLRGAAARLEHALAAGGVRHDVKEYPDAGHGFMNRHHNVLSRLMDLTLGSGFVEGPTEDAERRIVAFFTEHLSGPGGEPTAGHQPDP